MGRGRPPGSATGVVISADGPNASSVTNFRLRTSEGELLTFRVGTLDLTSGGLAAPHLREHLVSGIPITVFYYESGDGLEAVRYIDAPPS